MPDAAYWIQKLHLTKHVEGGSFRETYRSSLELPHTSIPVGFHGPRSASTAIFFLLESGQFSAFHRIPGDEVWHFYDGDPLEIFEIDEAGVLHTHQLGRNFENGESFQVVIKAGRWFGSRVKGAGRFSLVGCTVAPGFDFQDFELADRATLLSIFPSYTELIIALTY